MNREARNVYYNYHCCPDDLSACPSFLLQLAIVSMPKRVMSYVGHECFRGMSYGVGCLLGGVIVEVGEELSDECVE